MIAGGATQINIVIGSVIASLQAGAVSYLYYADRLYQLPLSIVGVAIGVVLLPDMARHLRAGDHAAVADSQNRSLEFALLLTLPAAVALAVIAAPISSALYERGAFTPGDSMAVAQALAVFAAGLPAFVMIKVFSPAFFAREDTRTPMRYAAVSLAVNTAGSIGLFWLFRELGLMPHVGIAVATTAGGWLNAGLLWRELRRRGHFVADARLARALPAMVAAAAAMGAALWFGARAAEPWLVSGQGTATRIAALALLITLGGAIYFGLAFALGALRIAILPSSRCFRHSRSSGRSMPSTKSRR